MRKLLFLLPLAATVSAVDLPEKNLLMWNKYASTYVETQFNRSTRVESLRTLNPKRTLVKSVFPAYFACGAWNIHSLPKKNDGSDHVPAGFNKLESYTFRNPQTHWVLRNEHFRVMRKVEIIKDSAIIKMDFEWESLRENYAKDLSLFFTPAKLMIKSFVLDNWQKKEVTPADRFNFPRSDTIVYTDETGKNGFAVFADQSYYAGKTMGAVIKLTSIRLPGYCSCIIPKGEKIKLTVYFALFNESDPVEAVKAARKKVFGDGEDRAIFRGVSRPVVTTGSCLIETPDAVFWKMAPELLPAETAIPAKKSEKWEICGAGNEFIAEQLVITPKKELKNIRIKLSDFVNGKAIIAAKNFRVESVVSIPRHSANNSVSVNGEYADRLLPVMPVNMEKSRHGGFLLSGRIPAGCVPGDYQATVEITADGGLVQKLPLTLKVYNFVLPETPGFYSDFLVSGSYADRYTKDKAAVRLFCRKDLVKLRLQPALGLNVFYDKDGKLTNDPYAVLKREFSKYGSGVQKFRIYGTFYCSKFNKLKPYSPEMDAGMKMFAQVTQKAFKTHGLAGNVLWQLGDECHLPDKLKMQIYYSKLTGEAAPELRRFATINGFNPRIAELVKYSDIIAPHTDIYFSLIRGKMDLTGKEVWIYDNGFMTCGVRLTKVRGVAWKSFKYGISGYHQWSVNAWVKNWRPGDDYSGCIYYPPENDLLHPQRSMRLVNYALTVSDYDYMNILNTEIKRTAGSPESKAAAAELAKIVHEVSPDGWNQTTDYSKIIDGRTKIAALIEKLQKVSVK